jgi:hypothetical protein
VDRVDLCAHQRPVHLVERQQRQRGEIVAMFEVDVQHPVGVARSPAGVQVHRQERDFRGHVDPAQRRVELDPVEDGETVTARSVVHVDHVAEVHVAVAGAHEPPPAPLADQSRELLRGRPGPGFQLAQALPAPGHGFGRGCQCLEVCQHRCEDLRRRSVLRIGPGSFRTLVETGNRDPQFIHRGHRQLAGLQQPVELTITIEAAHVHGVFEHGSVAAEVRVLDRAAHLDHVQIDSRRQGPVDVEFGTAVPMPCLQRREIQEAEAYGLLELVGVFSGQQHGGNVCLDAFHGGRRMRETGGIGQGREQLLLLFEGVHGDLWLDWNMERFRGLA